MGLQIHEYDAAARLVRAITRSPDGGDRTAETYEYDRDGRKKKTVYVDVANQRANTHYTWSVEGTDSCYSAPGAARVTTLYNERARPIELLFHDATDRLLSRVEFSYDAEGNLIQEAQINATDTLPPEMLTQMNAAQIETVRAIFGAAGEPIRRMHRYDGSGRRVETRSRMGLLGGKAKTMLYNDRGDQIAEVAEEEAREYEMDDEGQLLDPPARERVSRSEARFLYDYDANGNWVLKTIEGRTGTEQEFRESSVERRTIEYFD